MKKVFQDWQRLAGDSRAGNMTRCLAKLLLALRASGSILLALLIAVCCEQAVAQSLEEVTRFNANCLQVSHSPDLQTARQHLASTLELAKDNRNWQLKAHLSFAFFARENRNVDAFESTLDLIEREFLPDHLLLYQEEYECDSLCRYLEFLTAREKQRDQAAFVRCLFISGELCLDAPSAASRLCSSTISLATFLRDACLFSDAVKILRKALPQLEASPLTYAKKTEMTSEFTPLAFWPMSVRMELAKVFLAWKRPNDAAAELELVAQFIKENPSAIDSDFQLLQIDLALAQDNANEAIQLAEAMLKRHARLGIGGLERIQLRLGESLAASGQWERLQEFCEEVGTQVESVPHLRSEYSFLLARVRLALGEKEAGLEKLQSLLQSTNEYLLRSEIYDVLAAYYSKNAMYPEALELEQDRFEYLAHFRDGSDELRMSMLDAELEIEVVKRQISSDALQAKADERLALLTAMAEKLQAEDSRRKKSLAYVTIAVIGLGVMGLLVVLQRLTFERRQKESERMANKRLTEVVEQTSRELQREFELKERLEKSLERKRRDEAIGQLTGCVAHDFNNLLQVIFSANEVFSRRDDLSATESRLLDASNASANAGANVVKQLMAYARKQKLTPEPLLLSAFLKNVSSLLYAATNRQCNLVVKDESPGMVVMLDSSQLTTSLINLLRNAVDAMPSGGEITIATLPVKITEDQSFSWPEAKPGDYVSISVIDQGQGMEATQMTRAFEPFFSTKEPSRGVGLGLSSVYGFVKQSGGDIRIEPMAKGGTKVEMLFGKCEQAPIEQHTYSMPENLESCRVLLVEDDEQVGATLEHLMQSLGYKTLLVNNATDAIAMLKGFYQFDFVVTDYQISGEMNGLDLAHWISTALDGVGVILISGGLDVLEQETHTVLPKPFRQEQLFQAIYLERLRLEGSQEATVEAEASQE